MRESAQASSVATRQFCPKCKSFNIQRLPRGFVRKYLVSGGSQFKCTDCGVKTSGDVLSENEPRVMPLFVNEAYSGSNHPS